MRYRKTSLRKIDMIIVESYSTAQWLPRNNRGKADRNGKPFVWDEQKLAAYSGNCY
jgi:hypothetical protein